jgi:hypothetical protein
VVVLIHKPQRIAALYDDASWFWTRPARQGGGLPLWPEAPQANPKLAVRRAEFGFAELAVEHGELMTERQMFQHEPGTGLAAGEQGPQERQNDSEHDGAKFGL